MRRPALVLFILLSAAAGLHAQDQTLRDRITGLFIFGPGEDPLFLAGTADPDNPASIQAHGSHFVPSAVSANGSLILFLGSAIGANIGNLPISATSSGTTFRLQAGVPVPTSTSAGPIFAERAQTMGRGRVFVGAGVSVFHFKSLRGVPLDNVHLNFTHVNADFPGCDSVFGGDCSRMGIPQLENDVIGLDLNLGVNVRATTLALTYGLTDRIDIGVALPLVTVSVQGVSNAQVIPFGPNIAHFFAGTVDNPVLTASRFEEGSATGLGDVAVRAKLGVSESARARFAILADARLPTGNKDNFLGSGNYALRGVGIVSAQFGNFSPHANVGYLYRSGALNNDYFLATAGFDHLLAPWATLAVDLVSELQVGVNRLRLPGPVVYDAPFHRTVQPSSIPNSPDDLINGAVGFKFLTGPGLTIVTNALIPLNRGGLRPDVAWTASLEYNF